MSRFPIEVRKSPFGRGVFATRKLLKGDLIEVCPVLPMTAKQHLQLVGTGIESYVYAWLGPKQSKDTPVDKWTAACITFGYAMLYNHSFEPNAEWEPNVGELTITFRATKTILKYEEILHDYYWPRWKYKEVGIVLPSNTTHLAAP